MFEDRDTTEEVTEDRDTSWEEIIFRRNREHDDDGPDFDVIVLRMCGGEKRSFRVPRDKILAASPGEEKLIDDHLLAAIDNAE